MSFRVCVCVCVREISREAIRKVGCDMVYRLAAVLAGDTAISYGYFTTVGVFVVATVSVVVDVVDVVVVVVVVVATAAAAAAAAAPIVTT